MKRFLSLILSIFVVTLSMPVVCFAAGKTFDEGHYRYTVLEDEEGNETRNVSIEVISGKEDSISGEIEIPDKVENNGTTYTVTTIGTAAFLSCKGLTSVTIPNSVTAIEYSAFYGCTGLTSVTIPNSVTAIRHSAFYGCKSLASVTIPNSVTTIESNVFNGCENLTKLFYPSDLDMESADVPSSTNEIVYKVNSGESISKKTEVTLVDLDLAGGNSDKIDICRDDMGGDYIITGVVEDINGSVNLLYHNKKIPNKNATCTEDGNIEYWSCEVCGKNFSDEAGTSETTLEKVKIPAKGHTWSEWDATGKRTCTVCGAMETKDPANDPTNGSANDQTNGSANEPTNGSANDQNIDPDNHDIVSAEGGDTSDSNQVNTGDNINSKVLILLSILISSGLFLRFFMKKRIKL